MTGETQHLDPEPAPPPGPASAAATSAESVTRPALAGATLARVARVARAGGAGLTATSQTDVRTSSRPASALGGIPHFNKGIADSTKDTAGERWKKDLAPAKMDTADIGGSPSRGRGAFRRSEPRVQRNECDRRGWVDPATPRT